MNSDNMETAVVKYDGTINSLKGAIELCNGFEKLKPDDRVLLKPNIVWGGGGTKKMPKYGMVTTSRIIEDLILLLREYGCRNISIGEGTMVNRELGNNTSKGFKWCGITRVAKKYGVKLVDFNEERYKKVKLDGAEVQISAIALDADFLINLPVLKTHMQAKVSLGLKNLKGCLAMKSKMEFHKRDLEHMIALLNTHIIPSLTIIDGIYALEHGPTTFGKAYRMDLIVAGQDNLSCDIVGSTLLGVNPSSVVHLSEYAKITKRSVDLSSVEVRGESIKDAVKKFEWEMKDYEDILRGVNIKGMTIQFPGKHFCTGCFANLEGVLHMFCKDNAGITLDNIEICGGSDVTPKKESKKVILFGNCAIKANENIANGIKIKGCPPKAADTLVTLLNHTVGKKSAKKILMARLLKNMAYKVGLYNEDFPSFKRYDYPEFNANHF